MNAKRHCHAYTLIEVLVAMMILALSLTVIFRIFGGGLNKIGIASDYARAVMVAESVLAAAGNTEILQPGESTTFVVQLTAAASGDYSGELSFGNDDPDEAPFNFFISGTVDPPPSPVQIIDNGDLDFSTTGQWSGWAARK